VNATTHRHLLNFERAAEVLRQMRPDLVSADDRDRRTPLTLDACPWEAIDDALDLAYSIDCQPGPGTAGEPAAWSHWLRQAWLEIVRASAAAAGHGDDDAPRWQTMHAGQLADELTYMADFQG
jgi:hypothetical protein